MWIRGEQEEECKDNRQEFQAFAKVFEAEIHWIEKYTSKCGVVFIIITPEKDLVSLVRDLL